MLTTTPKAEIRVYTVIMSEKTSNMQSQDELYSFLGDRVGGFHSSAVRRRSGGSGWAVLFFINRIFNMPGKCAISFPFQNYKNKLLRKDY